jgi:hypothetical protein
MPSIWDEIRKDGPEFLREFGRPIVFRSQNIQALIGRAPEMQNLTDGGLIYSGNFSIRIYAPTGTPFDVDPPTQGERVKVWGKDYTITAVTHRPPDSWIDLMLVSTSSV